MDKTLQLAQLARNLTKSQEIYKKLQKTTSQSCFDNFINDFKALAKRILVNF